MPGPLLSAHDDAWQHCLSLIQASLPARTFESWFSRTKAVSLIAEESGPHLTVSVPDVNYYAFIDGYHNTVVVKAVREVLGPDAVLHYDVPLTQQADVVEDPRPHNLERVEPVRSPRMSSTRPAPVPRRPHPHNLNLNYTFENFIEGECNELARNAAIAIANNPGGTAYNPLMVYGGVGLGKTHLIQAIGNYVVSDDPDASVVYTDSERFTNEFIDAIKANEVREFSQRFREVDVLIVDDVQFFAGKEKTQDAFFHIFNALHGTGSQIVLSADRTPKDIDGLEERLLSRFLWGLTADMRVPELETRTAILAQKIQDEGLELPTEVIDFMAHNIRSNVRELEGALVRLMAHVALQNEEITLSLARDALKDLPNQRPKGLSIDQILEIVCEYLSIDPDMVRSKSRRSEIVQARHIAMYFCKEYSLRSTNRSIGLGVGGRNHSTVISAIKGVNDALDTDPRYKETVERIRQVIEASAP